MKKKTNAVLSILCYILGIVGAIYVGGYLLLICQIQQLVGAFTSGTLTLHILIGCIVKIALSTTVAGAVWCAGYIGYNHFVGTEDEYDRLMAQMKKEKEERRRRNKEEEQSTET